MVAELQTAVFDFERNFVIYIYKENHELLDIKILATLMS